MNYFPPDRTWGAVIMLLNGLCACLFIGAAGLLGAIFSFTGGQAGHPVAFGALGALVFIGGIVLAGGHILNLIGGAGIMSGKRWAFNLVLVVGIINVFLSLAQLPHGILGIALNLACVYYCYQRLSGQLGPRPT
jgi:uncharacterized membrane protein (DUF2068 family)